MKLPYRGQKPTRSPQAHKPSTRSGQPQRYSAEFKAKLALEALRGELTTAQLATKHGIHQTMVGDWKRQAMDGLTAVFADRSAAQA